VRRWWQRDKPATATPRFLLCLSNM
jgi:hypothetical protein